MVPWAIWTVSVAAINLMAFIAIRGRWGALVPALAVAAVVGAAGGNAVAAALDIEWIVLGEFHVVAASVGAQLAMIATAALGTLLQAPRGARGRPGTGRDGSGPGR